MITIYNLGLTRAAMALFILLLIRPGLEAQSDDTGKLMEKSQKARIQPLDIQDGRLLKAVDNPSRDTAQEKYFRALIGRNKTNANFSFFKVNKASLVVDEQFILNLPDLKELPIVSYDIKDLSDGRILWKGRSKDGLTTAKFIVNGQMVSGNIQTAGEYYQLRPLTGELHLLMTEAYDPEKDCGYDGQRPSKITPKQAPLYNPAPDDEEPRAKAIDECKIRLMVVYTNTVDDLSPNIADLIELEVDNFNDINANSDVDFQVELARSREVNYTETDEELQHPDVAGWDVSRDLYRLWHPTDGWMDDLHAERNLYDADMVVFMVDDLPGYGGLAFNVGVDASDAFCIMVWNNGVPHTFTHEFGHLIGMWHNPENSPAPPSSVVPFDYGFGHYWTGAGPNFRTVMSYGNPCGASGCPRISYWSNPDLDWGPNNVSLGTATRDNARVAREQQTTVAGFQSTINNKSVFQNTYIYNRESGNIKATSSIDTDNNTVRYYNGSFGDYTAGNSITFRPGFRAYYGSTFRAQLDNCSSVSSLLAAEKNADDTREETILAMEQPEPPEVENPGAGSSFELFPNPVVDRATFWYSLSAPADVELSIYDMNNRLLQTVVKTANVSKGRYKTEWDAQQWPAGIYVARLVIGTHVFAKRVVISKQ